MVIKCNPPVFLGVFFETERNDISVYNALYDEAVALVEQVGVVSSKQRTTGRQRNHANPDTKEYWRITLYYQFVDHLLKDLRDHLVKN
jgi:hypothetical protein